VSSTERPAFTGFHHYALAVSDIDVSAAWYERVLGLARSTAVCPEDDTPDGVLLSDPDSVVVVWLEGPGDRTGHSHSAFSVGSRAQLDAWAGWLDGLGIDHGGVVDVSGPEPYAYLVFRDPDDVPLVLIHVTGGVVAAPPTVD
jgi:glyoxylase I family protein